MIEVIAIFVACQINLLICIDLPFLGKYHTFSNSNECRVAVIEIVKVEQAFRIKNNYQYPIIIGKCKYHIDKNR